jgi:hypothetical protein
MVAMGSQRLRVLCVPLASFVVKMFLFGRFEAEYLTASLSHCDLT